MSGWPPRRKTFVGKSQIVVTLHLLLEMSTASNGKGVILGERLKEALWFDESAKPNKFNKPNFGCPDFSEKKNVYIPKVLFIIIAN